MMKNCRECGIEIGKRATYCISCCKLGDRNPMKKIVSRVKSSNSHKGKLPWNTGISHDEYISHYKNGFKGGGKKGFKHSIESKVKMSLNTKGKRHFNYNPSEEVRKKSSERMKKNRMDFDFNSKMFKSIKKNISSPHRKVLEWINNNSKIKTVSNYPVLIGDRYAEIDEANVENKIAIFVDGNYWHNYPYLRKWDKVVTTCLINKGWKVYRFWESDINLNFDIVKKELQNISLISSFIY